MRLFYLKNINIFIIKKFMYFGLIHLNNYLKPYCRNFLLSNFQFFLMVILMTNMSLKKCILGI